MNFSLFCFETAVLPVFADVAANPAPDGAWISTTAIGAVFTGVGAIFGAWIRARCGRKKTVTTEPSPLPVQQQGPFVTTGECKQHRCSLEKRIDTLVPLLTKISDQVASSSARAEERAVQLHRRLDPIVEKVAANAAELDLLKDFHKGGRK